MLCLGANACGCHSSWVLVVNDHVLGGNGHMRMWLPLVLGVNELSMLCLGANGCGCHFFWVCLVNVLVLGGNGHMRVLGALAVLYCGCPLL